MTEPSWRMDMHLHTHHSFDCRNSAAAILEAARNRGLDRIVVTDHNEIRGALELREMDPERVLIGEEVKTREGFDVIGILLDELIPARTPARETCERIRAQGGIVYLPHPFDGSRSGGAALLEALADLVDVVEVHNARCIPPSLNDRAREWAEDQGKLMGAGSDAHTIAELGNGVVELPPFEPTRDSLLASLARATIVGRSSSPIYRAASVWARVAKLIEPRRSA